jgi:hypothetical protein
MAEIVEALAASAGEPVGRVVPIELLDPNPNKDIAVPKNN